MKKLFTYSIALLFCSGSLFAQSKSELKEQLDKSTAASDSLKKLNTQLKTELDSVTGYSVLYTEIKEKVLKHDFNPADFPAILDSIKSHRDSSALGVKFLADSLAILKTLNDSLKDENGKLEYFVNKFGGTHANPVEEKDLMGTWSLNLFTVKVVGDTAQSGLVMDSNSKTDKLFKVAFVDSEFATVEFASGKSAKCFYKTNSFSKTEPFSIDLDKGSDVRIKLYLINTDTGLQVSYKGDGKSYLYGSMKKL